MSSLLTPFSVIILLIISLFIDDILACCTPDQWEGYQPSYGGYSSHHGMGVSKEFSSVSYDFINKRKAVFMTFLDGDTENRFQVITLCGDDNVNYLEPLIKGDDGCTVYVIDLQKNSCWKKKTSGFRKACIPKSAKDNGHGTIGLKDNSMKIVSWVMQKNYITAYVSVGMIGDQLCVPVSETLTGKLKRIGFMQYTGFIDITPGIKNETVFELPKTCKENLDTSMEAAFERDHLILAV